MIRCSQNHGRDLPYTGSAQHNTRIHQVRCFYQVADPTRPPPEHGEQEGEGILSNISATISNAFPSNKDGLARPVEPGEHHQLLKLPKGGWGRANYSGPGTNLKKRLKPPQAQPRSHVDRIAMKHDVDYLTARTEQDIRRADQRMLRNLERSHDSKFNVIPAKMGIASKVKLEDAGLMKKDKFISDEPADPLTMKRGKRVQRALAQEGLGLTPSELLVRSLKKKKKGKKKKRQKALWSQVAPKTRAQRKKMLHKCGEKCFAGPNMSYPVCAMGGDCEIDERGVKAARSRAKQFDDRRGKVGKKARKVLRKTSSLV